MSLNDKYEILMLADSQTFPLCTKNFIKIDPDLSKEFRYKHRDVRILYTRCVVIIFRSIRVRCTGLTLYTYHAKCSPFRDAFNSSLRHRRSGLVINQSQINARHFTSAADSWYVPIEMFRELLIGNKMRTVLKWKINSLFKT